MLFKYSDLWYVSRVHKILLFEINKKNASLLKNTETKMGYLLPSLQYENYSYQIDCIWQHYKYLKEIKDVAPQIKSTTIILLYECVYLRGLVHCICTILNVHRKILFTFSVQIIYGGFPKALSVIIDPSYSLTLLSLSYTNELYNFS